MKKENFKHTPGPWKMVIWDYNKAKEPYSELVVVCPEYRVAMIDWAGGKENPYTIQDQEAIANARLIAAAPDMLEALQNLYQHCAMIHKMWGDDCNQKEADAAIELGKVAIKKALGE